MAPLQGRIEAGLERLRLLLGDMSLSLRGNGQVAHFVLVAWV